MLSGFRIGVDVGGTNTDGVLLDPSATAKANKGILAWLKSPTTSDPSRGIESVITSLLQTAKIIDAREVASVTIGTTHFINAVLEKDRNRLAPVAIIRLCGPFSRDVYPAIDWPKDLGDIICQYCGFVDGGLEIDGEPIGEVDEGQIAAECRIIRERNIKSIVVNGIFSPSDVIRRQEERVAQWIRKYYPEADVVISKEVANLGFIERENAAILNASILPFARSTIRSFEHAMNRLQLQCPLFITQNDGTILPARIAARLPIRTFSSGPTNSMCGAAFLIKNEIDKKNMLVVDIDSVGGTSTDVGMLLASGLPRQAAAITEISGVRLNFSCPDVKSIALGGGSIVRKISTATKLRIGPDSVGHHIQTRALVFGGDVATATDYAVVGQGLPDIGNASLVPTAVKDKVAEYNSVVTQMLERVIDSMKTTDADIPVLLVGGGAILAPDTLRGASRVVKPEYSGVANAIGAAVARVSGTIDTMVSTADRTMHAVLEDISRMAVDKAVENGAIRESVKIAEMDAIPLNYVANKSRVIVKAIGDFDFSIPTPSEPAEPDEGTDEYQVTEKKPSKGAAAMEVPTLDITSYRPTVNLKREWIISEVDLEWISAGCYILGTGGGGTPYPHFVRLREMMRKGSVVRVIAPEDLSDSAVVACGGGKGSPTVSIEKLPANEQMEAQRMVYDKLGYKPDAVIALEIGGGNGLQGMLLGASNNLNVPTVDGDWMGRAYPVSWQITPVVLGGDKAHFLPTAIADGNGNNMLLLSGASEKLIERIFRAALSEMGSHVACAKGPCSGKNTKVYVVENTISLAWRIGRAVALCRSKNQIDSVAEAIIDEVGGKESAKLLFRGKIVSVERKTVKGHVYGEVVISASDVSGVVSGLLKIPFKNENIMAIAVDVNGKEEVVASVPDLISVSDASTGEAIGTPEYRYGLLVFVIGIQASEKWTSTPRGLEIGGPRAFGMDVDYKPLGIFKKPRSVIDEFAPTER
ncbi:hypothetical protein K438DRAFT_1902196 [Mycena galopus ATCC 62051]|nr:hypothetical protein K438DRAFT_1902196 [Mycena galopus ATCC 62051]